MSRVVEQCALVSLFSFFFLRDSLDAYHSSLTFFSLSKVFFIGTFLVHSVCLVKRENRDTAISSIVSDVLGQQ